MQNSYIKKSQMIKVQSNAKIPDQNQYDIPRESYYQNAALFSKEPSIDTDKKNLNDNQSELRSQVMSKL